MIIGRKPKLTAEQQLGLHEWAAERTRLLALLEGVGSFEAKAKELGIAESSARRYVARKLKRPIRQSAT